MRQEEQVFCFQKPLTGGDPVKGFFYLKIALYTLDRVVFKSFCQMRLFAER
jgi:hypothetical protein